MKYHIREMINFFNTLQPNCTRVVESNTEEH